MKRKEAKRQRGKGFLAICVLLALLSTAVYAQTATDLTTLEVANRLYENGRYAEAAQTYEQLVAGGVQDSTVFYNLGNAYYQQGDIGRAILNYERAQRLTPRDDDVQANLALAREKIVDQYGADDALLNQLTVWARSWLTLNEMAVAALGLWLLLGGFILLYRRKNSTLVKGLLGVTAVLFLGGLFSLGTRLYVESNRPVAIVVVAETAVASGPGEQYPTQFTLHSGASVAILDERPNWTRITLPGDQLQGWVAAGAVTAVDIQMIGE
jgi:tetratricopeptide (TPR) repeat protein